MWANNSISFYDDWFANPSFVPDWMPGGSWSFLVLFCTPFWREFHFYWIHRFSHWKPLCKFTCNLLPVLMVYGSVLTECLCLQISACITSTTRTSTRASEHTQSAVACEF